MQAPLAGIGVIELGGGPAIAYAGKLCADLGAEVTRITPGSGEAHPARRVRTMRPLHWRFILTRAKRQ